MQHRDPARQSRNQNEKSQSHHEGTKDTKVFVGCASRTGRSRNISREACPERSRRDAKAAKVTGGGPSSRAEARDLRKISPRARPELCRRGRNDNDSFLASLRLCERHIRIRESSITGKLPTVLYDKLVGSSFWIVLRKARR